MNLLPYIDFFLSFLMNPYLDGLYIALVGFLVLGVLLGLFGKRRYINV